MFFEFPGILITIGVFLLLISIIIIIVAYRSDVKDVDASKLSTNNHRREDDIIPKDDNIEEKQILENKEEKEDKKDLEKTKIFKPAEIKLEEQTISEENNEQSRPMGIKDMLEDINKVDDKKENEKDETIDIFDEEFEAVDKEENKEDKIDETLKQEKQEEKEPETKSAIEEDEDIELL